MPDDTVLLERHFNTAFAAPDGIQKLRELILTLAMQGKLVPQDPKDQPASELLKAIAAEKQQLVKEGKIKPPAILPEIKPEEVPHNLPNGWAWTRLGEIVQVINGRAYKKNELLSSGTPVLRVGNLFTSKHWYYSDLVLEDDKYIDNGDLIYSWSASFGPFIWNGGKVIYHYHIWKLNLFLESRFAKNYLFNFLLGETENIKKSGNGIAMIHMTKERMEKLLAPVPPLAEQRRIVAKIDRLMARCDELEKLRAERNQKRITVHTAALDRLLNAKESNDFSTAWRFITQHFGELYSVKENVAELRKAILQLAVMGKLVPQDPTDEPASELLRAIAAEKQQLVKEGQIKQPKSLPKIKMEDMPYTLPKVWEWIRLGTVVISSHAGRSPQCLPGRRTGNEWGVLKVSAVSWGTFDPNENKALPPGMQPRLEDEVKVGDFLLSRANTEELVARSVVVKHTPPNLMISDKTVRLIISDQVDKQFINTAHLSNHARTYYASNASGTSSSMKNVSREIMYQLPIPLPPLAEQRRIVAKIDQLMALCNHLDQQIDAATGKQSALLNAVMAQV